MEPDERRIVSTGQLPDDPLGMPPPYWRSSGAVFCMLDALEAIPDLLAELVPVLDRTEAVMQLHFEKYPGNEETEEFSQIMDDVWDLEDRVKAKSMVAVLMSAIKAEDAINMFCVYNLHKDAAESIEKLQPPDKLLIAAQMVGQKIGKGHSIYGETKALMQWRNAFAHGHCVDRPTRSLRHNHLIPPDQYPGIVSHLADLQRLVFGFVRISDYLSSISVNKYGSGPSYEVERSKELLVEIERYRFDGNDGAYTITVSDSQD